MEKEEDRIITWSVNFEIDVNGEAVNFWDLTEAEQEQILAVIAGDSYSGIC